MRLLATSAGLLLMAHCFAADPAGAYVTVGARSCGEYARSRIAKDAVELAIAGWMAGYLTAYNWQKPDTYSILGTTDLASAMRWMDDYCRTNPRKDVADGMEILIAERYRYRIRARPKEG